MIEQYKDFMKKIKINTAIDIRLAMWIFCENNLRKWNADLVG